MRAARACLSMFRRVRVLTAVLFVGRASTAENRAAGRVRAVALARNLGHRPAVRSWAVRPLGKKTKILYRVALFLWVLLCAATVPVLLPLIPLGLILFRLMMWDYRDVPGDFRRDWRTVRRWTSNALRRVRRDHGHDRRTR